jgi:hypothetical protein
LARNLAKRDFAASRKGLANVAGRCNACHRSFRIDVQMVPFAKEENDKDQNQDAAHNNLRAAHASSLRTE